MTRDDFAATFGDRRIFVTYGITEARFYPVRVAPIQRAVAHFTPEIRKWLSSERSAVIHGRDAFIAAVLKALDGAPDVLADVLADALRGQPVPPCEASDEREAERQRNELLSAVAGLTLDYHGWSLAYRMLAEVAHAYAAELEGR